MTSNALAAFDAAGLADFENSMIALQTADTLMATMIKRSAFTAAEIDAVERFAEESGTAVVYLPGRDTGSLVETFIRSSDKAAFIADFPRDITPTTDDLPYFFNFSKWRNPLKSVDYIHEPTSVSSGNPAFILGQLGAAVVFSFALILLPVIVFRRKGTSRAHLTPFLVYFSGLGIGFIFIEIALLQKLTLFLGHPLYSITVTLFAVLVFTGLGSLVSESWFPSGSRNRVWVPVGIAFLLSLIALGSPWIVREFIGLGLAGRVAVAVALLAPVGLLLGVPFAYGIRLVNRLNPTIVPWAWAINGCLTVVGSILSVIISMNLGFRFVLLGAALLYFASFGALRRLPN